MCQAPRWASAPLHNHLQGSCHHHHGRGECRAQVEGWAGSNKGVNFMVPLNRLLGSGEMTRSTSGCGQMGTEFTSLDRIKLIGWWILGNEAKASGPQVRGQRDIQSSHLRHEGTSESSQAPLPPPTDPLTACRHSTCQKLTGRLLWALTGGARANLGMGLHLPLTTTCLSVQGDEQGPSTAPLKMHCLIPSWKCL